MKWWLAVLGGVLAAGVVSSVVTLRKRAQFVESGEALALTLRSRGAAAEAWLTQQGAAAEEKIAAMARVEGERLARTAAEQHLAQVYGLTSSRMRRLQTLASRWG